MILRIEFIRVVSSSFPRALSLCKKIPSFTETIENGAPLYSVKFEDDQVEAAEAILHLVGWWRTTAFYIDGRLVPRAKAYWIVTGRVFEKHRQETEEARRRAAKDRPSLRNKIRDARGPADLLRE